MHHKHLILILKLTLLGIPSVANAHASEQGFVLLLPTDFYTGAGVAAVALTVLALIFVPAAWLHALFRPVALTRISLRGLRALTSTASAVFLLLLIGAGLFGPHDPLSNPLTLMIWTVFWIGFVTIQGLIGNLWPWLNPWSGPLQLIRALFGPWGFARLPVTLGYSFGISAFFGFAYLLLADPAPNDPDRLARLVAAYWLFHMIFAVIYGPRWLRRAEGFTLIFHAYSRLTMLGRHKDRLCLGLPGWQILHRRRFPIGMSLLIVILLGTGSFDGLNETFWWLARLGINPLEFPGRSAVIIQNTTGMLIANAALISVFAAMIALGMRLARVQIRLGTAFALFAPTLLPIALGYHVAHYLTSFLVDSQYVLVALSDPFLTGADWLGLGDFYVSTGFFKTQASVRLIFVSQVGVIVLGHVLAVLLAHAIALRRFTTSSGAALSQAPLAGFMIAYTLFGLWLLASPRF